MNWPTLDAIPIMHLQAVLMDSNDSRSEVAPRAVPAALRGWIHSSRFPRILDARFCGRDGRKEASRTDSCLTSLRILCVSYTQSPGFPPCLRNRCDGENFSQAEGAIVVNGDGIRIAVIEGIEACLDSHVPVCILTGQQRDEVVRQHCRHQVADVARLESSQ